MCNCYSQMREKREQEKLFEKTMVKSVSNFMKTINTDQSSSRDPKHKKHEETIARCIIIQLLKISSKEKILKAARKKKKKTCSKNCATSKHQNYSFIYTGPYRAAQNVLQKGMWSVNPLRVDAKPHLFIYTPCRAEQKCSNTRVYDRASISTCLSCGWQSFTFANVCQSLSG